jgi:hypothetical protein
VFEYEQQQRGRDRDVVMVRALHAILFLHGSSTIQSTHCSGSEPSGRAEWILAFKVIPSLLENCSPKFLGARLGHGFTALLKCVRRQPHLRLGAPGCLTCSTPSSRAGNAWIRSPMSNWSSGPSRACLAFACARVCVGAVIVERGRMTNTHALMHMQMHMTPPRPMRRCRYR